MLINLLDHNQEESNKRLTKASQDTNLLYNNQEDPRKRLLKSKENK